MTAASIIVQRKEDRTQRIIMDVEEGAASIANAIDCALDDLCNAGVFGAVFGASKERTDLCKRLGWIAMQQAIVDGNGSLPAEAQWILDTTVEAKRG